MNLLYFISPEHQQHNVAISALLLPPPTYTLHTESHKKNRLIKSIKILSGFITCSISTSLFITMNISEINVFSNI